MPRLIILLAMALPLLASEAASPARHFRLRAEVLGVSPAPLTIPRDCFRTALDAGFVVTARVISVTPRDARFVPHHTVNFAIHSPSLLFTAEDPRGRAYDFDLRSPEAGGSLWSLEIARGRPRLNFVVQHLLGLKEALIGCFVAMSFSRSVVEMLGN
jgi:hypothetical protein